MLFAEISTDFSWLYPAGFVVIPSLAFASGLALGIRIQRNKNNEVPYQAQTVFKTINKIRELSGLQSVEGNTKVQITLIFQDMNKQLTEASNALPSIIKNAGSGRSNPTIIRIREERCSPDIGTTRSETPADSREVAIVPEDKQVAEKALMGSNSPSTGAYEIDSYEDSLAASLVSFYNEATASRELRDRLWKDFEVLTIENTNAVDQRLGKTEEPEFRNSDSGSLYAIHDAPNKKYLVVPKFDLTVKKTNFESTVRFVFDCSNFEASQAYSHIHLVRPAEFVKEGERWLASSKGELILSF
jgi:hypothetical protein